MMKLQIILFAMCSRLILILVMALVAGYAAELRVCPDDYFFDLQHCEKCQPNCKCAAEDTCDECIEGYTDYQGSCIQCPQAASIYGSCSGCCSRTQGTILSCTDCYPVANTYSFLFSGRCILSQGCFEVDSNGFCQICRQGFYAHDNLCHSCDASCSSCIHSDNCLACADGYYWKVADGGLCSACPSGCATCDNDETCTSCLNSFYFYEDHCLACPDNCEMCVDGSTCTSCSTGILVSNLCIECVDSTYGGSTGCLSCYQENNFLHCAQCDDMYFLDEDDICRKCEDHITGASRCRDQNTPTQCLDDYHAVLTSRFYLVGISCVQNTKSCKKIADIHGNCSSCYEGYQLLNTGECQQCTFVGCDPDNSSVVSQVCTCTVCLVGYYLSGVDCLPCSTASCGTCPGDSCSACLSGFYFNGGVCSTSMATNCLIAKSGSSTLCDTCSDGFYLGSDEMCYLCQSGCQTCSDRFTCTLCDADKSLVAGRCISYPSNCVKAVASGNIVKCTLCQHGYYLTGGACLECSVSRGTLAYCDGLCPIDYLIQSLMVRVEDYENRACLIGSAVLISAIMVLS